MSDERVSATMLLKAVQFAAVRHQTQRQKDMGWVNAVTANRSRVVLLKKDRT